MLSLGVQTMTVAIREEKQILDVQRGYENRGTFVSGGKGLQ
jgi:hypothetical protein